MRIIAAFGTAALILFTSHYAAAESIKVGGSGGMLPLVKDLAKTYMEKHPGNTVEVISESLDAKGGIMGAAAGKLDVGLSARLLEPDELKLSVTAVEIARVATVPGVNAATVKVKSLSSEQICEIYSGKIRNWKNSGGHDAPIKALTRPEPDSTKKAVRKGLKCFSALKEDPSVATLQSSKDMLYGLTNAPHSLGFTDLVSVDESGGKVSALQIDGIAPTPENVISGKWPIVKNFVVVTKSQPSPLAKSFVGFIKSPEGAAIIKHHKAIAVK